MAAFSSIFGRTKIDPSGATPSQRALPSTRRTGKAGQAPALFFLPRRRPAPLQGRSAGPNFSPMRNWGKNRLGRSPLSTPLGVRVWQCVKPMAGSGFLPIQESSCSLQGTQPGKGCAASPPEPDPGGVQPLAAAGSRGIGGWEQPQHQGKARTGKPSSRRASCHENLVCWHHQEQQEIFRAVGRLMHCPLAPAGWIPQGGGRPRLWRLFRLFLAGQK